MSESRRFRIQIHYIDHQGAERSTEFFKYVPESSLWRMSKNIRQNGFMTYEADLPVRYVLPDRVFSLSYSEVAAK